MRISPLFLTAVAAAAVLIGCQGGGEAKGNQPPSPAPVPPSTPPAPAHTPTSPTAPTVASQPTTPPATPSAPTPPSPAATAAPATPPTPPTPAAQPALPTAQPTPPQPADGAPEPEPMTESNDDARRVTALRAKGPNYKPRTEHLNADGSPKYINRLIFESSPYLLQHAHNPVNWRAWGPEAFEAARSEDKPILMSVGYATCHWCHVMERESFEDEEIARYMNEHFICIKVDREERPDVDSIYMNAVHMLHGRGGWPMTIVMTPDKQPFFGGTYFPPRDGVRGARKGFLTVLRELSDSYTNDRANIVAKAVQVSRRLAASARAQPAAGVPGPEVIRQTAARFLQMHDTGNGGFGRQPKFPRPVTLDFLLRYYRRSKDERALNAVRLTLDKMAGGGIHDQAGGGFHRYAVDSIWLVPHFEKMLYDNAQLTMTYLAAYQITGNPEYARVARRTLDYVAREMRDTSGAFWSATDADSEGHEGTFFVWKPAELREVLGPELGDIAIRYWGVSDRGNFEHANILNVPRPPQDIARELGLEPAALAAKIQEAADKLYEHRKGRIPPLTDDKVLTAWNGLMVSAFARGAFVLGEPRYARLAKEATAFLLTRMLKDGRLLRTYRHGNEPRYNAYLEDYAFLGQGLIDLYEATGDVSYLQHALALHRTLLERYQDKVAGGFFQTSDDHEKLLVREKPDYDGAEPSGNSIAARNMLRLWEYTGDDTWRAATERLLRWSANRMQRGGRAVPAMLGALDHYLDDARQVIVVEASGDTESAAATTAALLDVIRTSYLPNRLLAQAPGPEIAQLAQTIPAVKLKIPQGGRTTAYVCERGVCKRPTSDPAVLRQQLSEVRPYPGPEPTTPQ